jgi:hypothetical protein
MDQKRAPANFYLSRAAKKPKPAEVIFISSDSEEEQATPVSKKSRPKPRYMPFSILTRTENHSICPFDREIKQEEVVKVEPDNDDLQDEGNSTEIPFDSIIDGDDSDEEDEVNGLLAED